VSEEKYEKMVEEQLEKLRQEKESRARDGAPTPPSPGKAVCLEFGSGTRGVPSGGAQGATHSGIKYSYNGEIGK